ncbi:MAG TPA: anthrone oxygenase family protein [Actinophytocola sp.]|nr:anthrone oxygenase family protein [Actinophytocola sp.]
MDIVRVAALVLATVTTGLVAGLFYGFAISVLIAMRGVDDRTYVEVNQRINRDIQNGPFFLIFLGSVLFSAVAAALLLGGDRGSVLLPAALGFVLNLVAFLVTGGGNVPLNKQLEAAGQAADPTAVRRRYEVPWTRLNTVRTVLHLGAFGALCWALVAFGAS